LASFFLRKPKPTEAAAAAAAAAATLLKPAVQRALMPTGGGGQAKAAVAVRKAGHPAGAGAGVLGKRKAGEQPPAAEAAASCSCKTPKAEATSKTAWPIFMRTMKSS
jgi:hypothetical protein